LGQVKFVLEFDLLFELLGQKFLSKIIIQIIKNINIYKLRISKVCCLNYVEDIRN